MENAHLKGVITAIYGEVAKVKFFDVQPNIYDLLTLDSDPTIELEIHSSIAPQEYYCLVLAESPKLTKGASVTNTQGPRLVPVGREILGHALDIFGNALDHRPFHPTKRIPVFGGGHPSVESVVPPSKPIATGIKAVDFFAPVVYGSKVGIFGGAGLGKTILLTELMNNIVIRKKNSSDVSMFAAVGERSREIEELMRSLENANVLDHTVVIAGQMGERPAVRFRTASYAAVAASYFRDVLKTNVLFFMDNAYRYAQAGYELSTLMNEIPAEDGYQPSLPSQLASLHEKLVSTTSGEITTIEAVYLPSDDLTDLSVRSIFPYLDSIIVLSRDVYQEGRLPAIDLLSSTSTFLVPEIIGEKHYRIYLESKALLEQAVSVERLVSLVGLGELSAENRQVYTRAQLLKNYMTQSFFVTESQSGRKGHFTELAETVNDVEQILVGKLDAMDPDELLFSGNLNDK